MQYISRDSAQITCESSDATNDVQSLLKESVIADMRRSRRQNIDQFTSIYPTHPIGHVM